MDPKSRNTAVRRAVTTALAAGALTVGAAVGSAGVAQAAPATTSDQQTVRTVGATLTNVTPDVEQGTADTNNGCTVNNGCGISNPSPL